MPLAHAILGFLEYQPMTGYDLKKYFDQSIAHFWSATQSHIYKALEDLEEDGFIGVKVIQQEDKPNRKEYHITPAGRTELHRWVTSPLPLGTVREAWLIQIFFSHASSNEEIVSLLKSREKDIQAKVDALRTEVQASMEENAARVGVERLRLLWQLTADYGIAYYKAELKWTETAIKRVRKLPPMEMPKQPSNRQRKS
ncbi:MAG TPA: PadR family transcriptional regulator [Anaerolineales bacterium]